VPVKNGNDSRRVAVLNPSSGTFGLAPSMGFQRSSHQAVTLGDGTILLVGGVPSWATAELRVPGVVTTSRSLTLPDCLDKLPS
jgi:hypothetical protein